MSTALGLAMQISANTAQLASAVKDVNAKLDAMANAGKKAADDLGVLKNIEIGKLALEGVSALGNALVNVGRAAVGAVSDLVSFGKSVADELDALNDIANRTGVSVEALQAYGAAAKLAGIDSEAFAKSLQKLTINIGKATGDEKAQKAFRELGIAFDELKAKSPAEQFEMVADALANISDPAERAAAAVKLFGKGGIELGPLFTDGPGAMKAMREEAEKLGYVVSKDGVEAIARMNDSIDKVFMTFKAIVAQVVSKLAPVVEEMANNLLKAVGSMGGENIANVISRVLLDAVDFLAGAFLRLAQFLDALVQRIGPLLGLDLRSEAQKKLDELTTRADVGAWTRNKLTKEELEELKELRLKVEKEAAEKAAQMSFETIVNTIKKATEEARKRLDSPTAGSGSARDRLDLTVNGFDDTDIVRELKELNRNYFNVGTVDIYGK